jgi:hypothetical protein
MPLDFISAVLVASESSEDPNSPRELSECHTTPNAEKPTGRAGTTGKACLNGQAYQGTHLNRTALHCHNRGEWGEYTRKCRITGVEMVDNKTVGDVGKGNRSNLQEGTIFAHQASIDSCGN